MQVKSKKELLLEKDINYIWEIITNPKLMVKSIPGAEITEQIDNENFKGKISIKIGPVTAKFNGIASFTKVNKSNYELSLLGKGSDKSGKGSANMTMDIKLITPDQKKTKMESNITISINGKLAHFGSRMIIAVNNKMFDEWSNNFLKLIDGNENNLEDVSTSNSLDAGSITLTALKGLFKKDNK